MKRLIAAAVATLAILFCSPPAVQAEMAPGEHLNGGLGFTNIGFHLYFFGGSH